MLVLFGAVLLKHREECCQSLSGLLAEGVVCCWGFASPHRNVLCGSSYGCSQGDTAYMSVPQSIYLVVEQGLHGQGLLMTGMVDAVE